MANSERIDVLLAYRYQADRVLNVVSQANILVENGLQVAIAETSQERQPEEGAFDNRVKRLVTRSFWEPEDKPSGFAARWQQHQGYIRHVRSILAQHRPKVVVAYDIDSCCAVSDLARKKDAFVIFHFCEQPDLRLQMSIFRRWKTRQALRESRFAQLIVLPDPYRAAIFRADTNMQNEIMMVPNCPRLVRDLPKSVLRTEIEANLGRTCRLIAYLGGIAPGRGLIETIESIKHWPEDAVLLCRGLIFPDFAIKIRQRAEHLGVAKRVVIQDVRGFERDSVWASDLSTAEVGLAFHEPLSLNQLYSAFASTKLHQYMSAGIPVIARAGPGFDELVELAETGECVNMNSPESLGQAVTRLLTDETRRVRLGQNGRRLHLTRFNYELCFAPVRDRILEWCKNSNVSSA
jgi:glycosyltransferase involved in cell wall biosynthesis